MNLQLALDQKKMSIIKSSSGKFIESEHKYDPTLSSSATYIPDSGNSQESIMNYESNSNIMQLGLRGNEIIDEVRVGFKRMIDTNFMAVFLGVDGTFTGTKGIKLIDDGFIGLAPYPKDLRDKERNFMYQLKKSNYIDHMVFSIYLSMDSGNSTHIKFVGYDKEGILGGKD